MFEPNEYFTNPVLTKEYFIRFSVEDDNPLGYEGPDIVRCTGSVSLIHVMITFVQITSYLFSTLCLRLNMDKCRVMIWKFP